MKTKLIKSIFILILNLSLFQILYSQDLQLRDQQLLITLGNSITELGEKPDGYVSVMRKVLKTLYPERTICIVNAGIGGHKSTDMNERFERDVLQYHPHWVSISVGVNDVWHGFFRNRTDLSAVSLPIFEEKVTDMIRRAQAAGTRVALFTATVIKEDLSGDENRALIAYNNALRKLAKRHACLLMDMDRAFRQALKPHQKPGMPDRGVLTYDGVHMLPSGNWLMAKTALVAFGVPEERIDAIQAKVDELIDQEMKSLEKNFARYEETNFEVGLPRDDEKRIVFYGSSSVDGWNLAKDFPDIPFLNRGIGGETTRQMVMRFGQDVIRLKPTAVILFYGSCNDFWHPDMPLAETQSNTIKIARFAEKNRIALAIGAVSPVNDYLPGKDFIESHPLNEVQELNAWLKNFCQQNGHTYIDFYTAVADSSGKLAARYTDDGMHCNAEGYAQWKPLVVEALKELGAWEEQIK